MERQPKRFDALVMAYTAWLAERQPRPLGPKTRYEYRIRVEKAARLARDGGYSLMADDVRVVRYVLGRLSPHPASQRGYLAALTHFYDFLIVKKLRKDNPARLIGRPPAPRYYPRPIDVQIVRNYFKAAREMSVAHEAIATLGYYQGFRRKEMRACEFTHFFQAEGRIWIDVTGKGDRRGRVPAHPRVVDVVHKVRASHNDPRWLFPSPIRWGYPMSLQWFDAEHRKICESAGIQKGEIVLHQLRHSFATYLRRSGADGAVVQRGMRHASFSSTLIYMDVLDDELAAHIDNLDYGDAVGGMVDDATP